MNTFPLLGTLSSFLIFICSLLVIFLVTVNSKNKLSNQLLALYFLIYSIHISVFFYINFIQLPPILERLRDQIMFLSSPILYLYLVSSIYSDFKFEKKHLLHLIPFTIDILIFVPRFYLASSTDQQVFLNLYNEHTESRLSAFFASGVSLFYLVLMFMQLIKYKRILNESYSNQANFNFRWLFQLTILLAILFMLSQVKQVYFYFGTEPIILKYLRTLLISSIFLFLTWIVFKCLYYPDLFRNIDAKHLLLLYPSMDVSPQSPERSKDIERLIQYINSNKPFVDASLSLSSLAEQVNLTARDLSELINQEFGCHFHEFINNYRIDEAKKILESNGANALTVQEIMYESGFNSKSSFYTQFKKRTNQTPTQYRKQRNFQ